MATRPLVSVFNTAGERDGEVAFPAVFNVPIRPDVVQFVHDNMAKNKRQAYAVNVDAGHQTSAESWGTGRAVSRIPRVQGGGTQRSGQGAFGNMCRGGRMFAPTKVWRKWHKRINLNQRRYATTSALAASAVVPLVMARGHRTSGIEELPLVIADDFETIKKTRDAYKSMEKLGLSEDVDKAKDSKKIRRGKGKMRNRRYVKRRGPLVIYSDENAGIKYAVRNLTGVDTCHVSRLNLLQLAPGGHMGRLCVWTKSAFAQLDTIYGTHSEPSSSKNKSLGKSAYTLPKSMMTNPDIGRIINSDEVQSVVNAAKEPTAFKSNKNKPNPLKNTEALAALNPYAATFKKMEADAAAAKADKKRAGKLSKEQKATKKAKRVHKPTGRAFYENMNRDQEASDEE